MADKGHYFEEPERSDLLSCLKRLICQALLTFDGLDRKEIDSCFLKLNKKLDSGDLIIPAFVRTCFGDINEVKKFEFQRLCQEISDCVSAVEFVRLCQVTSGGHLLLSLNKCDVTSAIFKNVIINTDQYGKSSGQISQCVLLNPAISLSSQDEEHLNLDQLRTILICEHTKELLHANGVVVKSTLDFTRQVTYASEDKSTQSSQGTYNLFSPSLFTSRKIMTWTDKDLSIRAKELYKVLKSCKYTDFLSSKSNDQVTNNTQSCSCLCEGDCSCEISVITLDLYQFCKDNEQLTVPLNKLKVTLSSSLLKDVARLDLVEKNAGNVDMLLHVTSCKRAFIQQQTSTVWEMTSTSLATKKQFNSSHGVVSLYKEEQKLQDDLDPMDLLRIRKEQLRESYILKYGDKVEGRGWDLSIREMAVAVIKLEILSSTPNSEVKINLSETSREFRQATFVLYNCARLAKLFANFEENVRKGVYPRLPPVYEVDFNLLRDQAEWELTLNFIVAFPSVVKDAVSGLTTCKPNSKNVTIHTNKICCFLFNLSHKFSSYYGRVHILGESRQHLFPTMFARLYLMKALQQIFLNCLKLLNVNALTQM